MNQPRDKQGRFVSTKHQSNGNGSPVRNSRLNEDGTVNMALLRLEECVFNAMSTRKEFLDELTDPRRDIASECGHPSTADISSLMYRNQYDRNPVATRVVDVLPEECWSASPAIFEDEDPRISTEFEDGWHQLDEHLRGTSWFQDEEGSPIWEVLKRADKLSGIGHYGIILLGLDDGDDLSLPVNLEAKGKKTSLNLLFLRVFDESMCPIIRREVDPSSPRFGQPTAYNVTFDDPRDESTSSLSSTQQTKEVHWSRVIHIADNIRSSETFGVPRMRPVFNRLLDCDKLYAGSAEMYWQGAFPGIAFETHPSLGVEGYGQIDQAAMRNQVEQYFNRLQRYLAPIGLTAKTLSPQVVDPTSQIDVQIEAICIQLAIPLRIFKGSERGELASSQDKRTWNERLQSRRLGYITPRIIVPFVDRLIMLGILPQPKGYSVSWPDIEQLTLQEQSDVAVKRVDALAKYIAGGVDNLIPPMDFLTRELGYTEEEAASILEAAETYLEEKEEEQAEKQEEQMKLQAKMQAEQQKNQPAPEQGQPGQQPPPGQPDQTGTTPPPKAGEDVKNSIGPFEVNAFCPTGKGGGIDPTCSPKSSGGGFPSSGGKGLEFVSQPANPKGLDTQQAYKDANGNYTKERASLHDNIIEGAFNGKSPVKGEQPIAYMMGGGPASGKSTVIKQGAVKIEENTVHIDSDEIKGQLPEYQNGLNAKNAKTAAFVHEESSELAKRVQKQASEGSYNTLLDGTGDSSIDKLEGKTTKMRAAGQKVVAHYVTVPTDVAVERSNARGKKTGRVVPESVIRSTHKAVSQIVPQAIERGLFDEFDLWDTSEGSAINVATVRNGRFTVNDQNRWQAFLDKGNE